MTSFTKFLQIGLLTSFICLSAIAVGAQDLGSTSGVFKPKKTASKKSSSKSKKPAARKKTKTSSSKTANSSRKSSRTSNRSSSSRRSGNSTRKSAVKEKKVEISKSSSATSPEVLAGGTDQTVRERIAEDVVITIGDPNNSSNPLFLQNFEDAITAGNSARNRRLYEESEAAYAQARKIDPNDSRAVYGLGNVYSDQQRWEEAENAYRTAVRMEPNSSIAKIALSYVLTQPVLSTDISRRYVEAEKLAREAIAGDPENALAFDQLGVALELSGLIDGEAEESYRKAIALDPTFALAHAHLGRLLRKQGKPNESSKQYREAIRLAANIPTKILVADVLQSQQRYLESEQLLRHALRGDPRNPTALHLLGSALTVRRRFDEAESILQKGIEVSPESFESHKLLGALYSRSGDFLQAEQSYLEAMNVASENEKRFLSREFEKVGDGFMKVNRPQDAARLYRRAVTLDTGNNGPVKKLRNMVTPLPLADAK